MYVLWEKCLTTAGGIMAKISAIQRAKNKEKYDAVVVSCFFEKGWNYITLNNIAKELGLRKSSAQAYYPSKMDFGLALKGKVFPVMMNELDLTSPESFISSWEKALTNNKIFTMVVHLLVSNATSHSTNQMTIGGITKLQGLMVKEWKNEAKADKAIYHVLGLSVMELAKAENEI